MEKNILTEINSKELDLEQQNLCIETHCDNDQAITSSEICSSNSIVASETRMMLTTLDQNCANFSASDMSESSITFMQTSATETDGGTTSVTIENDSNPKISANDIVFTTNPQSVNTSRNVGLKITNVKSLHSSNEKNQDTTINKTEDRKTGENLKQLSTNALPPYSPGTPALFTESNIPLDTYCCCDCGDTFFSKASLIFHLERRSVLIQFDCKSCSSIQVFYNRCKLLSHVRAHTDNKEQSDVKKATVLPLPRVLMDGVHTEFMKTLEDFSNVIEKTEAHTPTKLLEVSIHEISTEVCPTGRQGQGHQSENVNIDKKIKCSECDEEFDDLVSRKDHFTNKEKIPIMIMQCSKCDVLCPSKCSLKAHKRIHLQISPYICPECGDNPDRFWENFQRHLKYKCFHFSRAVGYKCSLCNILSHTSEALKKHVATNHTEAYVKCEACPMAFKSAMSFHTHRRSSHGTTDIRYRLIFKCALCEIVFLSKEQMLQHLDAHVKDRGCQYTFNCIECGKARHNKTDLYDHLKLHHPKIFSLNVISAWSPCATSLSSNAQKDVFGMNKSRVECILCHCSFLNHQGYSIHISKSHSNYKYPCGVCGRITANRSEMATHGKRHLLCGVALCLLCQNKPIKGVETLDSHLLHHVECVKFRTFCPICERALYNFEEVFQHLRFEHKLTINSEFEKKVSKERQTESNINKASGKNEHDQKDKSIILSSLSANASSSSAQHKISQAHERSKIDDNCAPLAKKSRKLENCCAKCDFNSLDRVEFKKHILTHKDSRSTFQCQECGLCFVVEPSLCKHLKIIHKIADVNQYLEEEGTNNMPETETPLETTKNNSLECTVCFQTFSSETLLKTHMRSHGMAFIQAKKTSAL